MHVQCLTLITELEEALHIYKMGANPLVSLLRCPLCLCVCLLFSLIPCSNFLHLWELLFAKLPFMRSARTYMWAKCRLTVRVLRHASLHKLCCLYRGCTVLHFVICHTTPVPTVLSWKEQNLFFCTESHLVSSPFPQLLLLLFQFFSCPVGHILEVS